MPSASAKLEKQPSTEVPDFIKQVQNMVEKKVRNLEKRKGKLDNYKAESANGKELNEDQLKAVSKYEQVVEMLDFSKDLQKSVLGIIQDCAKQQKRIAKREQMERQQQEIQRFREVLFFQDLLNNMGSDEIRQDFLNGTNGAVKLLESDLDQLDGLYKLVCPNHETEQSSSKENFSSQLFTAAEHLCLLLDGKNKEVLGTTYKNLKETLMKISTSGYFDPEEVKEEEPEVQEPEVLIVSQEEFPQVEEFPQEAPEEPTQVNSGYYSGGNSTVPAAPSPSLPHYQTSHTPPQLSTPVNTVQPPLQDVLIQPRGSFNFLQESQVDLESPHMDPAVVVAHPMAPPPMGFHPSQVGEAIIVPGHITPSSIVTPTQGQTQQPDFDPARPIPTQTFTNQNFAAMQNIIPVVPAPAGFVTSVPSAPGITTPASSNTELPPGLGGFQQKSSLGGNSNPPEVTLAATGQYHSSDDNEEATESVQNSSHSNYRGGRGNRGGRSRASNGYQRGRGSYSNGRGNFQGYYNNTSRDGNRDKDGNREGYGSNSSNPRRGSGLGPRGPRGGRGGNRGGGNYRNQE